MSNLSDAQDDLFKPQFDSTGLVVTEFGSVDYIDLSPKIQTGRPLLVLAGWAVGRESYQDLAGWLYRQNRRLLLVDFTGLGCHFGQSPQLETSSKTAAVMAVVDEVGVGLVDILAHSQGALVAVDLAQSRPELVGDLVLAMPSGMIGPDSALSFGARFSFGHTLTLLRDWRTNPTITSRIVRDACRHLWFKPARAWRELRAVAKTAIDQDLSRLRQSANHQTGRRIGILQAGGDHLTPRRRLERRLRHSGGEQNVDSYVYLATRWAGHNDLLVKPDRAAAAALAIFDGFAR